MKYLTIISLAIIAFWSVQKVFLSKKGAVSFRSDAPLELIEATSNALKGAIDTEKRTFAFTILMSSFEGFNSPLQKEHFKENYLETHKYPKATFKGKIIEQVNLTKDGTYTIRAKGKMTIHGVAQERIIKSTISVKNGTFNVKSDFTVLLVDHDITIPKIVYQKIAEEIDVKINAEFVAK